ncbi:MAG: UvrB/UvrC motif-containing protein [Coraliomargaritaceae bacterium]
MPEKLKCSLCAEEATVHLTQIINNKIHKVDLCESCAQQKGVTDPEGFALTDLLQKANFEMSAEMSSGASLTCPDCGYASSDFQRTGRLGCSTCYPTFSEHLSSVLEDMHTGLKHTGKVPDLALQRLSSQANMLRLEEALARAIAEEAYEQAATLRDEIQSLQAEAKEEEEMSALHD